MAKLPRYVTSSDVQMRLAHTYALYKGKGVYIQEVSDGILTTLDILGHHANVSSEDEELDLTSPPTGYCLDYDHKTAYWVARLPLRQQKQGLEAHCVTCWEEDSDFVRQPFVGLPSINCVLRMIDGVYEPTINGVYGKLRSNKFQSVPINRNFCLVMLKNTVNIFGLKFMSKPLGLVDAKTNSAIISHKYGQSPVADALSAFFNVEVQKHVSSFGV